MHTQRLQYGELLLRLMQRDVQRPRRRPESLVEAFHAAARDERLAGLCDRFERVTATLSADPLTWDGDNA